MEVTETHVEGLRHEFKVVLPAEEIDGKVEKRLAEVQKTIRLPGFRPGKVPVNLLRKKYGQSVRAEVLEDAVQDGTERVMNERGLRPAAQPKVDLTAFEDGGDLEFTLAVEALPDIEAPDFSDLRLTRLRTEPSEESVASTLERLAGSRRTTEPLDERRPAKTGDVVLVDFVGAVGGEEFPGGKGEGVEIEIGAGRFIPGFEEQLEGASPGEARTVTVTFPETYPSKDLAGKEAEFAVDVKQLRKTVTPAIDDAFAREMGLDDLEALKSAVREQTQHEFDSVGRMKLKRELLDKLSERYHFPVPEGLVEAEFDSIWPRIREDLERGEADPSDRGKDEAALKEEYRAIAERRVRLGLLLSEVGRLNNITVTQEELNRAMVNEASRFPGHERKVVEYYQKDPRAMGSLRAPIFEEKVVDFILEMAQVEEKPVTPEELMADPEAAEGADETPGKETPA